MLWGDSFGVFLLGMGDHIFLMRKSHDDELAFEWSGLFQGHLSFVLCLTPIILRQNYGMPSVSSSEDGRDGRYFCHRGSADDPTVAQS